MNTTAICKVFWRLGIAALLLMALRPGMAQAPSPPPTLQSVTPEPAAKPVTQLVTVKVIAQDNRGRQVTGLTKDDFELFEDNVPQPIRIFAVGGSLSPSAANAAPSPALPAGIFTNIPPNSSDASTSAAAIVLDGLNTDSANLAMARLQVAKFLQRMQPQDRVAIYTMGTEVKVIHDFSGDSAALLQALNSPQPGAAGSGDTQPPSLKGPSSDDSTGADNSQSLLLNIPKSDSTLRALQSIGDRIAGIPGRKSLVWISAGFPLKENTGASAQGASQIDGQVQEACRLLSRYDVAVYPMDVYGQSMGLHALQSATSSPGASGTSTGSVATGPSASPSTGAENQATQNAHESGYLMAKLTGGRVFYDQADLGAGIRSALDDSKLIYVLGYYPAQEKWDSRFHTFTVQVKRPGLKLLYRAGYLAVPNNQAAVASNSEDVLKHAVLAQFDSSAITLFARLRKGTDAAQNPVIDLLVEVNDLTLEHDADHWKGRLDVVIAQRSSAQEVVANGARRHSVDLNLPDDSYAKLRAKGLELFFAVNRDPGTADVRVVVHDARSGAVGTITIPLGKT